MVTEQFADLGRILVIIPTYNEKENVERITARVRAAVPEAHILILRVIESAFRISGSFSRAALSPSRMSSLARSKSVQ